MPGKVNPVIAESLTMARAAAALRMGHAAPGARWARPCARRHHGSSRLRRAALFPHPAQVCAQVMGNHTIITVCGASGNFELNVMLPVAAYALLQSIELLSSSCVNFARQCVKGLAATPRGPEMVNKGLMTCTNLVPYIGYDASAKIAKKAAATGRTIAEVAVEETKLSAEELAKILDPVTMVEPAPRAKL